MTDWRNPGERAIRPPQKGRFLMPSLPRVTRGGFQRAGPPLVRAVRSAGGEDDGDSVPIKILMFSGVSAAGIWRSAKPLVRRIAAADFPARAIGTVVGAMRI